MPDKVEMPTESRMKRLRVGDKASWTNFDEHPPTHWEGEIKKFTNVEGTYLEIDLTHTDANGKETSITKELTEDDVTRIG